MVQTDSTAIATLISKDHNTAPHPNKLVRDILSWMHKDWVIEVSHSFRERNRCVDWLANASFNLQFDTHIWSSPSEGLQQILRDDGVGAALPHLVFFFFLGLRGGSF